MALIADQWKTISPEEKSLLVKKLSEWKPHNVLTKTKPIAKSTAKQIEKEPASTVSGPLDKFLIHKPNKMDLTDTITKLTDTLHSLVKMQALQSF